jgi:hypothetical protein
MTSYNKVLVKTLQIYDGEQTLKDWTVDTGQLVRARQSGVDQAIYQRLLSHAVSIGLDINMVPENSKLILTINIRI